MIKNTDTQKELMELKALTQRLIPSHPLKNSILDEYKKRRRGLIGEREVAYRLQFLDSNKFIILHDLRFSDRNGYFQIDKIILCKKCIFLLEIKNWYGTIIFGENGQVTRMGDDGIEEGLPNPIAQARLQKYRLQEKLQLDIPIIFFVCISFPSTIIKSSSPNHSIPSEVIHANNLLFTIREKEQQLTSYTDKINELKVLTTKLLAMNKPRRENTVTRLNVSKDDLIKGVFCPQCNTVPMRKEYGRWRCLRCSHTTVDAHIPALNDYKLLLGNVISNQEAREFLLLDSPHITKDLLQKSFQSFGNTKGRRYLLTEMKKD